MDINEKIIDHILKYPEDIAFELLRTIFDDLPLHSRTTNKYELKKTGLVLKARNVIKLKNVKNIELISKEIVELLWRESIQKEGKEMYILDRAVLSDSDATLSNAIAGTETSDTSEQDAIRAEQQRHRKRIEAIEHSKWLSVTEKQAIMCIEDGAYLTSNLTDISEKARWHYYRLAKIKLRLLKELGISG